jgi:glycolate oxidase
MIPRRILREISRIVGDEHILTRPEDLQEYASDATRLAYMPEAVAFPGDAGQVSQVLALATRKGFPVIPRGAGTGMSGGALAVQGGLVLGMKRFDHILGIDPENLIAKVEPGVVTAHFQRAVEEKGLFYPPDPASLHISSIGGNVAECAGGLKAVKYGVTRDYVLGLTVVLPTGEVLKTGVETVKGVAGYDLTRLIVGSEGTLAVITSVTLRLLPLPEARKTMAAFFFELSSAAQTVSRIIRARILPTTLEFMDKLSLDCVREEMGIPIPQEADALLLIEIDGDEGVVKRDAERIKMACLQGGALSFEAATNREEADRLWEARRNVSPSLYRLAPHKMSEDVVVPRSRIAELVDYLGELSREYRFPIPAFGHAGDGNIHVNIMLDENKPGEKERGMDLIKALFKKVIEMRGTITGEHGVGITKAPYLSLEIPLAGLNLMARIKKAFDPMGILNPGKIFHGID